jgi:hypothetical protein
MAITKEDIRAYHQGGKVGMRCTKPLATLDDLCVAYTLNCGS